MPERRLRDFDVSVSPRSPVTEAARETAHQAREIVQRSDVPGLPVQTGVKAGYSGWMFAACLPLGPCFTSKLTFWFSCRDLKPFACISEKCANRSSPPSSGVINPKPFASLNHFTVPVAIFLLFPNR